MKSHIAIDFCILSSYVPPYLYYFNSLKLSCFLFILFFIYKQNIVFFIEKIRYFLLLLALWLSLFLALFRVCLIHIELFVWILWSYGVFEGFVDVIWLWINPWVFFSKSDEDLCESSLISESFLVGKDCCWEESWNRVVSLIHIDLLIRVPFNDQNAKPNFQMKCKSSLRYPWNL